VVDVAPAALEVRVTARNAGRRPVRLEYGDCALTVLAYRTPARTGTPAWRSDRSVLPINRAMNGGQGVGQVCRAYLALQTLAPGDTTQPREFGGRWTMYEVLADSLPDGRYYLRATLDLNWGPSVVDAGAVVLRRAQAAAPGGAHGGGPRRPRGGPARGRRRLAGGAAHAREPGAPRPHGRAGLRRVRGDARRVRRLGGRDRGTAGGELARWVAPRPDAPACPVAVPSTTLAPGARQTFAGRTAAPTRTEVGAPRAHLAVSLWLTRCLGAGDGPRAGAAGAVRLPFAVLSGGSVPTATAAGSAAGPGQRFVGSDPAAGRRAAARSDLTPAPVAPGLPQVAGVVIRRGWQRYGVEDRGRTRTDSVPTILVVADPDVPQRGAFRAGADTVEYTVGSRPHPRARRARPRPRGAHRRHAGRGVGARLLRAPQTRPRRGGLAGDGRRVPRRGPARESRPPR
jgi:hypothetical protein